MRFRITAEVDTDRPEHELPACVHFTLSDVGLTPNRVDITKDHSEPQHHADRPPARSSWASYRSDSAGQPPQHQPDRSPEWSKTGATQALHELRSHVAELLHQLDTVTPPPPDESEPPGQMKTVADTNPVYTWHVHHEHAGPRWRVHHIDDSEKFIYLENPRLQPGDLKALPTDEARNLALAILAAADRADAAAAAHQAGVTTLTPQTARKR